LIETTLTTVLAFETYLIAERLHVNGVLAVVAAGILNGNIGPRGMSPTTRVVLFNFWEYLAFIANSLVFLLIGLELNVARLLAHIVPITIAIVAVVVSRVAVVYGLAWVFDRPRTRVPLAYQHVLFWGGLRGAVSLALVLSLPVAIGARDVLTIMAFGVVLFTLLVQGTTMQFVLRALGLVRHTEEQLQYQRLRGRLLAVQAGQTWLQRLHNQGTVASHVWEGLAPQLAAQVQRLRTAISTLMQEHAALQATETVNAHREGLLAQRSAIEALFRDGVISEIVHGELLGEIDAALNDEQPRLLGLDDTVSEAAEP
jgi:CPA1 family monovalent cation:H+ antiporter